MIADTSGKRFWVILRVAESQPLGTPRNPTIERFAFKNLGGLNRSPRWKQKTQLRTLYGDNFKASFLSTKSVNLLRTVLNCCRVGQFIVFAELRF